MKRICQSLCAVALAALFACSALGGQTQTPGVTPPPPDATSQEGQTQTPGSAETATDPTMELVIDILTSLLPLF